MPRKVAACKEETASAVETKKMPRHKAWGYKQIRLRGVGEEVRKGGKSGERRWAEGAIC